MHIKLANGSPVDVVVGIIKEPHSKLSGKQKTKSEMILLIRVMQSIPLGKEKLNS